MVNHEDQASAGQPSDMTRRPSIGSLLVAVYFLLLLGCGIWLIKPDTGAPDGLVVAYAMVLVFSLGGLIVRQWIFGFEGRVSDRRNYIDLSRSQWFGRRGRSKNEGPDGRQDG